MAKISAATNNSENPYNQATVFNLKKNADVDLILLELSNFLTELRKTDYDKPKILNLYNLLNPYITIDEGKGKLFIKSGFAITGVKANGVNDWDGSISFNWNKITDRYKPDTTWVARQLAANILCLIEVEDRITFKAFKSDRMYDKSYDYQKAIDGDDYIGIDIGLLSNYPVKNVKKHIFDKNTDKNVCNHDCLEIELKMSDSRSLFILLNHLTRKDYGYTSSGNGHRKSRTGTIHDVILKNYNLLNGPSLLRA